jgi:mannose-binding lectin 2
VEGDFHGSVERFTGFGVIFDTFKNTETLAYHRDISIVYNDGDKTSEFMLEKKEGCDANIRFHENRGDFNVKSSARAKVSLEKGRKVTVQIDANNDGTFVDCASMELPFENPEWSKQAHVGITASTGQLADNHDVS